MQVPLPGSQRFLPSLLGHVRAALPAASPLDPLVVHVLLLAIVAGDRHLVLRTHDHDVALVAKLASLTLSSVFGYTAHRLRCHPNTASQPPSDFLRALFFSLPAVPADSGARHRHRRGSIPRTTVPVAPSASISTARSRRTSFSHSSKPSITTLARPEDADARLSISVESALQRPGFHPTSAQTDSTLTSSTKTHLRYPSRGSTESLKFPSAIVVSGLELASLVSQKALLRTLTERNIILSDGGILGHDHPGITLALPDDFLFVYVCRSDPRERPPIYKCLLDMFAMSSSVDVSLQTRLAVRQFRPNVSSPSTTLSSPHASVTSAAFSTLHSLTSFPGPPPPPPVHSPVIPPAFLQRLKHLCATQAHIRPPLCIYLADLFSATRHYGPLDAMMLTVRARQDAEALARASRVLGTDPTGAELVKEHAEQARETNSVSTYPRSQPSMASVDAFDPFDSCEPLDAPSLHHSLASQSDQHLELDVSEADIARIFPRVVSHRVRVRDSPFDEILSSAVCGATSLPGNESQKGKAAEWERETVKDILVHILAEV